LKINFVILPSLIKIFIVKPSKLILDTWNCFGILGMEEKRLLSQNRGMAVHHRGSPSATVPAASAGILERRTCTIEKCLCPYKQNRKHQEKM